MKKIMLLLASSLLLVSCGSNKVKYALQTIKPFVPVEIPEAHDIDKETARSLTDGLIVEYDRWDSKKCLKRGDFVFRGQTKEYFYDQKEKRTTVDTYDIEYKNIDDIERYFTERDNNIGARLDTLLIHKQTNDYGNVLFISKNDIDLDALYTIAYTEKETAFSAGSMSVSFKRYIEVAMGNYYNRFSDYNKFFEFIEDDNFNHTVKYASRGKGSLILETTSVAKSPINMNNIAVSEIKYKMEFFGNFLVGYEYQALSNSQAAKYESLSLTYERPEIELPDYWKYHIK